MIAFMRDAKADKNEKHTEEVKTKLGKDQAEFDREGRTFFNQSAKILRLSLCFSFIVSSQHVRVNPLFV